MKSIIITLAAVAALSFGSCNSGNNKPSPENDTEASIEKLEKAKKEAEEAEMRAKAAEADAREAQRQAEFEKRKIDNQTERRLDGNVQYSGKIGGKYAIVMDLDVRKGFGSYYYTKYGPSNRMTLSVENYNEASGRITISEYNPDGDYSGEFNGHIDGSSFTGTMTNYKGQTFSFDFRAR